MGSDSSTQPLFDAAASSPYDNTDQIDFVPGAVDAAMAPTGGGSVGASVSSALSSVPTWAWLALGGLIILKVIR